MIVEDEPLPFNNDFNFQGNPYTGCIAGECDENSDCGPQRACKDYKCVDPCQLSCGQAKMK